MHQISINVMLRKWNYINRFEYTDFTIKYYQPHPEAFRHTYLKWKIGYRFRKVERFQ